MNHRQNLKDNKFSLNWMILLEEVNNQNLTSSVSDTHDDDSAVFTIRNEQRQFFVQREILFQMQWQLQIL